MNNYFRKISIFLSTCWYLYRQHSSIESNKTGSSIAWIYITPIIPLGFYVGVGYATGYQGVGNLSKLTYSCIGISLWLLFTSAVAVSMTSIVDVVKNSERHELRPEAFLLINIQPELFNFLIRSVVTVTIIYLFTKDHLNFSLTAIAITVCCVMIFIGLGLLFGLINLAVPNFSKIIKIGLQYGIFFSGAIFPIPNIGFLSHISLFNPFYNAIELIRSMFVGQDFEVFQIGSFSILFSFMLSVWGFISFLKFKTYGVGRL